MAYTHLDQVTVGGDGNGVPTPNYYFEDLTIVYEQFGSPGSFGPLDVIFRSEEITVIAAFDAGGNPLMKMALPCPPYHEPTNPEAKPGKFLANKP